MRHKLTAVSIYHYIRLVYRSILFLLLLGFYIMFRIRGGTPLTARLENAPLVLMIAWSVYVIEMIQRFFPSRLESPGCQKQFAKNYRKSGNTDIDIQDIDNVADEITNFKTSFNWGNPITLVQHGDNDGGSAAESKAIAV